MGLHTTTGWRRWLGSAEAATHYVGRLNIGPRLIVGFGLIVLSMLAANALMLWQFHVVRTNATRLNDVDQKLVAVSHVHTSVLTFANRLDTLANSEDADQLVTEAGPLREAVLTQIRRATTTLGEMPADLQGDPSILPTLHVIQTALTSHIDGIRTLAASGDWRAVHRRLENQVHPLASLASTLVESVAREAADQHAQVAEHIQRVQRLVFIIVPLTVIGTLLIAATLGIAITRSITRPLARLVEGSHALARGEFDHRVAVTGQDELADLGHVFNDTARQLRDLYATLQRSEDRLRRVIDTIPAYAWSARADGGVDFINKRFLEFSGRPPAEVLGWEWDGLVHPDDSDRYVAEWRAALAAGTPMESQARVRRADGAYRWLLIRNVPLRDEQDAIVNWYGTAIDIEERHRAEEALRRSEAYLHEAQKLGHIGSWAYTMSTRALSTSPELVRIFGGDPDRERLTTDVVRERIHPDDWPALREIVMKATRDTADVEMDYRIVRPDGSVRHVHSVAHPVADEAGQVIEFVGTIMDVTERKLAEQALADLAGRLIDAQEQERSRIARELHDHISQSLGVLTIRIDQLDLDRPATEAALAAAVDGLRQKAREIIQDVHHLSHRLHSSMLDYLGLVPAMQRLVNEFSDRQGIAIEFVHAAVPVPLASDVALCLYRLAEESLTNIAKHSGARSAYVRLTGEAGVVHLRVEDTGAGFDTARLEGKAGLGLVSMQERVRLVRGTIRVESAPTRGTRIDVWIPSDQTRASSMTA